MKRPAPRSDDAISAGSIDALLSDGDHELAWETAVANPAWDPGAHRWLRLAESRERHSPADALAVYWRVADSVLQETDRRAYAAAVKILKRARAAAESAGQGEAFVHDVARLRERHRRRPDRDA